MTRRLVGGAVNLAWTIKYAVQAGWARIVLSEHLLPLTGHRATESGVARVGERSNFKKIPTHTQDHGDA